MFLQKRCYGNSINMASLKGSSLLKSLNSLKKSSSLISSSKFCTSANELKDEDLKIHTGQVPYIVIVHLRKIARVHVRAVCNTSLFLKTSWNMFKFFLEMGRERLQTSKIHWQIKRSEPSFAIILSWRVCKPVFFL